MVIGVLNGLGGLKDLVNGLPRTKGRTRTLKVSCSRPLSLRTTGPTVCDTPGRGGCRLRSVWGWVTVSDCGLQWRTIPISYQLDVRGRSLIKCVNVVLLVGYGY